MKSLIFLLAIVASSGACATFTVLGTAGYVLVENNSQQDCVLFRDGNEVGILRSGKDVRQYFWSSRQNMLLTCRIYKYGEMTGFVRGEFYPRSSGRYGYRNQDWSISGYNIHLR